MHTMVRARGRGEGGTKTRPRGASPLTKLDHKVSTRRNESAALAAGHVNRPLGRKNVGPQGLRCLNAARREDLCIDHREVEDDLCASHREVEGDLGE